MLDMQVVAFVVAGQFYYARPALEPGMSALSPGVNYASYATLHFAS